VRDVAARADGDDRIVLEQEQRVADLAGDALLQELLLELVRLVVGDAPEPADLDLTTSGNSAPPR
jgi:hypothetical protein